MRRKSSLLSVVTLGAATVLALTASGPAAYAQRITFSYTGKLVTWTVPKTGFYQIIAFGAQGGTCNFTLQGQNVVGAGGFGAEIGGTFILTASEVLQIAVGGAGSDQCAGGGGGGSFVVDPDNRPLVIAGGGGGGGFTSNFFSFAFGVPGQGGLTSGDGDGFLVNGVSNAGIDGNGGGGGVGFNGLCGGGGGAPAARGSEAPPTSRAIPAAVAFRISLAGAPAAASAAAGVVPAAAVTVAAAGVVVAHMGVLVQAAAGLSTEAQTRSRSPISKMATARP